MRRGKLDLVRNNTSIRCSSPTNKPLSQKASSQPVILLLVKLFLFFVLIPILANLASAETNVSSCQVLSSADTVYALNASISSDSGVCFNITANNVTIDGRGFSLTYAVAENSSHGIYSNGSSMITVKDLIIFQTNTGRTNSHAIYIINSSNNNITNVTFDISGRDASPYAKNYGVYFHNTSNNSVSQCNFTIRDPCYNCFAVYLRAGSHDSTVSYNHFRIYGSSYSRAIMSEDSNSQSLINNSITHNGYTHGSIFFRNTDSSLIENNSVTTTSSVSYAMRIATNSDYNAINNNRITTNSYGIYFNTSSDYTNISFVNITSTGNDPIYLSSAYSTRITDVKIDSAGHGIYALSSSNGFVDRVSMSSSGSSSYEGIYLSASHNWKINNTNITCTDAAQGLYITGSSNNSQVQNTHIKTLSTEAIYAGSPIGTHTFKDSVINSSGNSGIYFASSTGGSKFNLTNTTYGDAYWTWGKDNLSVFWYLEVHVNDTEGNDVDSAIVNIYDKNNEQAAYAETNATGWIDRQEILFILHIDTDLINYKSPHIINITKDGYHSKSISLDMDTNRKVSLTLVPDSLPGITVQSPVDERTYASGSILLNISSTDNTDNIWYNFNGNNVSYTEPVIVDFGTGEISLTVYANNSEGLVSESLIFNVSEVINLSECQKLTSPDMTYRITQDINSGLGTCLEVQASNITIDGQGFTLTYAITQGGTGIFTNGYELISIKDLVIKQSDATRTTSPAIMLVNSKSNNITRVNISVTGPSAYGDGGNNHGIYFYNTSNSTIQTANITTLGECDYCYGVFFSSGSDNNTFRDSYLKAQAYGKGIYSYYSNGLLIEDANIIGSTGTYTEEAVRFTRSHFNTINRTNVTATGSAYAINFVTSSNNSVLNTKISTQYSYGGIRIADVSRFINITSVNITSTSNQPIYITNYSHYININVSRISCEQQCLYGLNSYHVNINNVDLTATYNTGGGQGTVYLNNARNWTFNNTNVTGLGTYNMGFGLSGSYNITIQNTRVQTGGRSSQSQAFEISSSYPVIIKDSYLNASNDTDIYFASGTSILNFTNVTFVDKYWNSAGTLNIFWYLDTYVNDTSGSAVEGANVTTYDVNRNQLSSSLSNSIGRIERQTVFSYVQTDNSNISYKTPHNTNVSKEGYYTTNVSSEMLSNKEVVITLTAVTKPDITILSPQEGVVYASTSVLVNITNSSNTEHVWYQWNNTNYTFTGADYFDFKIEGQHTLMAFANNTNGTSSAAVAFNISLGGSTITECQELTSPDITYFIGQDINSSSGVCFEVKANNVTIDGQGNTLWFAISGQGTGIHSSSYNQITIKNLNLKQPSDVRVNSYAIHLEKSQGHNITNNSIDMYGYSVYPYAYNYGIFLYNASNTSIENNYIVMQSGCYRCYGILMSDGSHGTTIRNNTLSDNGYYSSSISSQTSNNHFIFDNTINSSSRYLGVINFDRTNDSIINSTTIRVSSGGNQYAILIEGNSDRNTITSSRVISNQYDTVYVRHGSDYTNITWSNISGWHGAITVYNRSYNTIIDQVNVICTYQCIDADSNYGIISNTNISATGASGTYGAIDVTSSYWKVNNTNISVSGNSRGIRITSSGTTEVQNTNVQATGSSDAQALYLASPGTVTIKDSIFSSANDNDIYLQSTGTGATNFTNVSFSERYWSSSTTPINVFWYLNVYVNDTSSNPVEDAYVFATNSTGQLSYSDTTNSSGFITSQEVLEYTQTGNSAIAYQTNYTVRAEKNNYLPDEKQLNITSNTEIFLTLQASGCGVTYHSPGTYNLTGSISGEGTCINIASNNILLECNGYSITGNRAGIGINNSGGYDNISVRNCVINNFSEAINFDSSDNINFRDNIIDNSSSKDVVIGGTSNITFLNTTFNKSSTTITGGKLNVKWFLDVYVNDSQGDPLANVTINATDAYGAFQFINVTDATGYIQRKNLTEYYENSTTKYYYTNYTLNFTSAVTTASGGYVNLTTNKLKVFTLETKENEDNCTDGLDNDGDGQIDKYDLDCHCDRGNDTTTCYINSTKNLPSSSYSVNNLVIEAGGVLQNTTRFLYLGFVATGDVSLEGNATIFASNISITANNLSLGPNAIINTSEMGYNSSEGPGQGTDATGSDLGGTGAGHGGTGGRSQQHNINAPSYGSITNPTTIGSGGGYGSGTTSYPGGSGGGLIIITTTGTINNNGTISANAGNGYNSTTYQAGGGSAGSINLKANTITGTGSITSNGGTGGKDGTATRGGGGAGGRIALYYDSSTYAGAVLAKGGNGNQSGGAGTIYLKQTSETYGGIIINNQEGTLGITNITEAMTFDWANLTNTTIQGTESTANPINITDTLNILTGTTYLNSPIIGTSQATVFNGAILSHSNNTDTQINILNISCNNLTIELGGSISANENGYGSSEGPGAGTDATGSDLGGTGAGHGGAGGRSQQHNINAPSYGSITNPTTIGSGGGYGSGTTSYPGGSGGGLIIINTQGKINNNGTISANAGKGFNSTTYQAGGGSGGSIWLTTNTITGTGTIQANGGTGGKDGTATRGGGGAGGRVSINYQANAYTGSIAVIGGTGNVSGSNGTVFFCTSTGSTTCPGISGSVILNMFSPNSTININRSISQEWNQSFVKWNDTSSTEANFTYNVTGLTILRDYDIYNNSQKLQTLLADTSGNLPEFYINFSTSHEIIVQSANQTSVRLNSPIDSSNLSSIPVEFNCTAMSNNELANITLYLGIEGLEYYNYVEVSGTDNTTIFSESPGDGHYTWNCYACDSAGSCSFSPENRTLVLDTVAPTITIIIPENDTDWSADNVTFTYIVSDDNLIFNCTLFINDLENISSTTITKDENQTFSVVLENGQYNWSINCTDRSLNIVTSGTYNFTVTDVTAPAITIVNPENYGWLANTTESVIINITTDENANCKYSTTDDIFEFETDGTLFTETGGKIHTFNYTGLTPSTNHTFYYKCNDSKNNINEDSTTHYFQIAEGICDRGTYTSTCWVNTSKLYNGFLLLNNLIIESTGSITHSNNSDTQVNILNISCANLTIESGGGITANQNGYTVNKGPGAGTNNTAGTTDRGGTGAGHGGTGGRSSYYDINAPSYGSITNPTTIGSGGGHGYSTTAYPGGSGGGLVIINATGTVNITGTISATGGQGIDHGSYQGGGGSGGSIHLTTSTITGTGNITANGGTGGLDGTTYRGGGGAGGKIAIHYNTKTHTGNIEAKGGQGYQPGGAGTTYLKQTSETYGGIIINNQEGILGITNITESITLNWLNITNATIQSTDITGNTINITEKLNILTGTTYIHSPIIGASNAIIYDGATVTHRYHNDTPSYLINITCANLTIQSGGIINITGKGYGAKENGIGYGPGGGNYSANYGAGGAGYGGAGGTGGGAVGGPGGASYGNMTAPIDLGSGGGGANDGNNYRWGGSGGGAVIINATNKINIAGIIAADGTYGEVGILDGGGGGSGGSIYLTANTITGTGTISTDGGDGADASQDDGGGGSGGRIALIYNSLCNETAFATSLTNTTTGGSGYQSGEDGTIFIGCTNTAPTVTLSKPENDSAQSMDSINFSWAYYDGAGDIQNAYQIMVDNDSDFSSPEFNITANSTNTSIIFESFNATTYYWKVRSQDFDWRTNQADLWSDWTDTWQFITTNITISWVNADPSMVAPGENINISASIIGSSVNSVKVLLNGTYWPMANGGSGNIYWNDSVSSLVSANHSYTVYANDSSGNEVSEVGYVLVSNLNISLSINPNPGYTSKNITFYGRVNLTNRMNISDNPINLYIDGSLYLENYNTGLLELAGAQWWNTSFPYRTRINISSLVTTSITNAIIPVNLSTSSLISAGKMNSDCGDTRFADANGNELQYTLETSTCNTGNTIYWVWANLTGSAESTIYAYYGNSDASLPLGYTNPDDSLILYLHFDNSSVYGENSTFTYDFSNNQNHARCNASHCPTLNSTGKYGMAYSFNGLNRYFNISDDLFDFANNFTIMAWARTNQLGKTQEIICKAEAASYFFGINSTNSFRYGAYSGGAYRYAYSDSKINVGEWNHVVGVVNGTHVLLYINGVLQANKGTLSGNVTSSNTSLAIGVNPGASYIDYFNGTIDEVRIYNRTLTADEILAIYNSTANNYITNQTYTMTDSSGEYNYTLFTITPGDYEVKANTTYGLMSAEATQSLTVNQNYINISLDLNPNPTNPSTNVTISGHLNESDSTGIVNNPINIYINNVQQYYNATTGLLENNSENQQLTTDSSGDYNYTFTVPNSTGSYAVKVNATYSGMYAEANETLRSQDPLGVYFTEPTDNTSTTTNRTWSLVNVTVVSDSNTSAFIDWNRSLVGWWNFDSYNDTGVYDNSTYDNFATFQGGLSASDITTGKYGNAIDFDGVDDYINTSFNIPNETGSRTITAWVKISDKFDNDTARVIIKNTLFTGDSTDSGISWVYRSDQILFYVINGSGYRCTPTTLDNPDKDRWYHITLVHDNSNVYSYVDGILSSTITCAGSKKNTNGLKFGTREPGSSNFFNGSIDEVMVFSRALSPEEVNASFNAGAYRLYHNFTGLADGTYSYTAYAIDEAGTINKTEERSITIDTRTNLTSCGDLSVPNSYYRLVNDVNSTGTCFNIIGNNITLDGQGFLVNYSTSGSLGYGVLVSSYNHSVIKNLVITEGALGDDDKHGIYLNYSHNSLVFNNTINTSDYLSHGVMADYGSYNNISSNRLTNEEGGGVFISYSIYSETSDNNITNGFNYAIHQGGNHGAIRRNRIKGTYRGIWISFSENITLTENNITTTNGHCYSFYYSGVPSWTLSKFNHTIGPDNLAEGKPVNFTFNAQDVVYDGVDFTQFGQVIFAGGSNITIKNSNFSNDNLALYITSDSIISNNNFAGNNSGGLLIESIYSATVVGNNATVNCFNCDAYQINYLNSLVFANNTGKALEGGTYPLKLESINNSILTNNSLTSYSYYYSGIRITSSSNLIFDRATIITQGGNAYGIHLRNYNNNITFQGMNISTLETPNTIYLETPTHNITIMDSILKGSSSTNLSIQGSGARGTYNLTNVTTPTGGTINISWSSSATATLNYGWWLDANITTGSSGIDGATVNATSALSSSTANTTNSAGMARIALLEYTRNNTGGTDYTYYNNYTVNATASGYSSNATTANMTTNRLIILVLNSLSAGVNCTDYKCIIIRAAGEPVAIFDALGAVDLKATLVQSASTAPGANDFIVRNSSGVPVAWVNTTGHLLIKGSLVQNTGSACAPPSGSFFILGNNSECVAYFNNTGDLYLKGGLREGALT